jgi:hypothetical protein
VSVPRVYTAINSVAAELAKAGIAKARVNRADGYFYRSIDDVYDRLAPLLSANRLCILPRVLERGSTVHLSADGERMQSVIVKAAFDVISAEDGSAHVIESFGEALDAGDKGTSKAMSAAYKYAMLQAFCIPVGSSEDADADTHRLVHANAAEVSQPVQGWEQWIADVQDVVRVCESAMALDRLQETHRQTLSALARERWDLYEEVGRALVGKRQELAQPPAEAKKPLAERGGVPRQAPRRKRTPRTIAAAKHV